MPAGSRSPGADALEVFADWLSRRGQGQIVEFDALVRQHPSLEAELRELHATWERLSAASEPDSSTLQQRLESRFGKQSLTEVSLRDREDGGSAADLSSALIRELSTHDKNFGRYQIRGEVARGGMGAILKVWDEELRRHLAMKVILGQADAPRDGATPPIESSKVARFLEEAQVTGQLDHPGIVPVHELGLDPEGRLYFTMKLVKGESLHAIFEHVHESQDDWSQTRALNVLLKVCEAMAYAHDKGVIHRDLKPANVMVGKFGEVHVMDWGLARIEGQKDRKDIRIREEHPRTTEMQGVRSGKRNETPDSPLCTMDGDVVGTPAYMPPEQAAGKVEEVGPHSDVYALGAMLYHLIAGHPPYLPRGVRLNNYAVWARVQEGPPKPIEELVPAVAPELAAICNRAMARDWRQRYRDMSELAEDLSAYLNQRVVRAYETGTWAETRKWVQRNKSLAASLAAALLLLAAGLSASLLFKSQADARAADLLAANTAIAAEKIVSEKHASEATREKNDVLKLSAFRTLSDLEQRADMLWPADPEHVDGFRAWIKDAEELLARLPEFRASLAEIEKRALPQSAEERERERAADPRAQELAEKRPLALWMSRMLGKAPWPSLAEAEAELSKEQVPADAVSLNRMALALLLPRQQVLGAEMRAMVLAQHAFAAATPRLRTGIRSTLAQAYLRVGKFDEALAEASHLVEEGGSVKQQSHEDFAVFVEDQVKSWRGQDGKPRHSQTRTAESLAREVALLEAQVERRQEWRFPETALGESVGDLYWHDQLQKLVDQLELLGDDALGLVHGVSRVHGLGIARRLEFASTITERSVTSADARRLWADAIAAISQNEKYDDVHWPGGDHLKPQHGLLPLGADPDSGLWEFADLATGEPAQRGADGKLELNVDTGLVFVLLPGGSFLMGAQKTDSLGRNYDPAARSNEAPVHEVKLGPFLLSKYEMTQGQWLRIAGNNPSMFSPASAEGDPRITLLNPVENVDWLESMRLLQHLGLVLPTEAQWEYGCRGGTSTAWWTGQELESLDGKVNCADQAALRAETRWFEGREPPPLEDGWIQHAPVGSLGANSFGLHDMVGNVWETCGEALEDYSKPDQVDPFVPWRGGVHIHAARGAGFGDFPELLRSAARDTGTPEYRNGNIGLRPAWVIAP